MRKFSLAQYAMLALMGIGGSAMMTSCKDYSGDIDDLQNQINGINSQLLKVDETVGTLQGEINKGNYVAKLEKSGNNLVVTMSDGSSYTIEMAANGTGTAWTIGSDGYWYENGVKTEYKATGSNGDTVYCYPNEDGYWWKVTEDPSGQKTEENMGIKWTTGSEDSVSNVDFAYAGNYLTISFIDSNGDSQTVKLLNGAGLAYVEFMPSVLNPKVDYPTTDNQIYNIDGSLVAPSGLTASTVLSTYWNFNHAFDKSNQVLLEYRISPSDAYVANDPKGAFINRDVKTRTDSDKNKLMNNVKQETVGSKTNETVLQVTSTYNQSASHWIATQAQEYDFVAFQLNYNGSADDVTTFTSDYIAPDPLPVAPRIVVPENKVSDYKEYEPGYNRYGTSSYQPYWYYDNIHPVLDDSDLQTDSYLKHVVGNPGVYPDLYMMYNGSLDLSEWVALYGYDARDYSNTALPENDRYVGPINYFGNAPLTVFNGISYEFSLPEEYLALDTQNTNQQWFVQLNGSVLSVDPKSGSNLTQAINRTPVVRVDAYMTDNYFDLQADQSEAAAKANRKLVASSYIKIEIVDMAPEKPTDKGILERYMQPFDRYYHNLYSNAYLNNNADLNNISVTDKSNTYYVAYYDWTDFNRDIYSYLSLNSQNFWNHYGSKSLTGETGDFMYSVTVEADRNNPLYSVHGFATEQLATGKKYNQFTGYLDPVVAQKNLAVTRTFHANQRYDLEKIYDPSDEARGILFTAHEFATATETTNLEFFADYNALTDLSYEKDNFNVNNEKGNYKVTITILSNDRNQYPDIVLSTAFNITNEFEGYQYNLNYFPYEWNPYSYTTANGEPNSTPYYVATKGKIVNNSWALQMNTMEAFEMINGQNVFDYYANQIFNAGTPIEKTTWNINPSIDLILAYQHGTNPDNKYELTDNAGVAGNHSDSYREPIYYGQPEQLIKVVGELDEPETNRLVAPLQYAPTFYNGEVWDWYYNVLFINPFWEDAQGPVVLSPNFVPGIQYVDVRPRVQVKDENDNVILTWNNTLKTLELTNYAINNYVVNNFWVEYGFIGGKYNGGATVYVPEGYEKYAQAYEQFSSQLTTNSSFGFDLPVFDINGNVIQGAPGVDGVVTYWNNGATQVTPYELMVVAKVHFTNVSVVYVYIPFSVVTEGTTATAPVWP